MSRWSKRAERDARPDPFAEILDATRASVERYEARPIQVAPPLRGVYPSGVTPREHGEMFLLQREILRKERNKRIPKGNSGDDTGMDRLRGIVRPIPHGDLGRSIPAVRPRYHRVQARGWGFVRKARMVRRLWR